MDALARRRRTKTVPHHPISLGDAATVENESRGGAAANPDLLLVWLSPAFPVGGFSYSHGLEKLVETREVSDEKTLTEWLTELLQHGSLGADLIILNVAWRAQSRGDLRAVDAANELALALQPAAERYLETTTQGAAFADAVTQAWSAPEQVPLTWRPLAYPVAVGVAAASHRLALEPALGAYAIALTTNLVSAAVRLGLIGQSGALRVIAELLPLCRQAAQAASLRSLDDVVTCTFAADIASIEHETQYTRLFRS